jgi:hypothetical protein
MFPNLTVLRHCIAHSRVGEWCLKLESHFPLIFSLQIQIVKLFFLDGESVSMDISNGDRKVVGEIVLNRGNDLVTCLGLFILRFFSFDEQYLLILKLTRITYPVVCNINLPRDAEPHLLNAVKA